MYVHACAPSTHGRRRARTAPARSLSGLAIILLFAAGCSDESDDPGGTLGSGAGSSASGGPGGGGDAAGGGAGPGSGGTGGSAPAKEYAAVIRGTLADSDLEAAKAAHDQIAQAGEEAAKASSDIAHDVLLGTTLLDSIENEFLSIDRWTDAASMVAFYENPRLQEAFAGLFAGQPTIEFFEHHPEWVNWGDMSSGDAYDPYYFHFALGVLADDPEAAQQAHDQVAAGGKEPSIGAGNVAHVVLIGLDDPQRFLGVDIWKTADTMEAFYTNPDFVAVFAPLFESVSQPVYQSTDWYQW